MFCTILLMVCIDIPSGQQRNTYYMVMIPSSYLTHYLGPFVSYKAQQGYTMHKSMLLWKNTLSKFTQCYIWLTYAIKICNNVTTKLYHGVELQYSKEHSAINIYYIQQLQMCKIIILPLTMVTNLLQVEIMPLVLMQGMSSCKSKNFVNKVL